MKLIGLFISLICVRCWAQVELSPPRNYPLSSITPEVVIAPKAVMWTVGTNVNLRWSASTNGTNIQGYNIYWGYNKDEYGCAMKVGNVTSATVSGLPTGAILHFAISTRPYPDTEYRESLPSSETVTNYPRILHAEFPEFGTKLEWSKNLLDWESFTNAYSSNGFWTVVPDPLQPVGFYRQIP